LEEEIHGRPERLVPTVQGLVSDRKVAAQAFS
jgi:hypothetical protein